jgi:CRISPR-associated exonuclease Cas4
MYKEEEFLQLSGIQHYMFCKRQWALIHVEQQWDENLRTVEGTLLHKKAHDKYLSEKRGTLIISRGMAVYSAEMGISGECDVVEFRKDDNGINIQGNDGKYSVCPVEYKRGQPKTTDIDRLQLAAQVMCLEEMLCCEILTGYLYYSEIKRREIVEINELLRNKVRMAYKEMHDYFARRHTPKVKRTKACNACSLKELCLPLLNKSVSAIEYINHNISDMDERF